MYVLRRSFITGAAALAAGPALAQGFEGVGPPVDLSKPKVYPKEPGPLAEGMVRVNIQTGQGLIVVDLNQAKAPITAGNFLRYVDTKRYDGSTFYRASKPPNATDYGIVQGGLQNDPAKVMKPIAHEPTTKTGILNKDGAITMARNAPGTATSDFFIVVGDSPYLDANPNQLGDNLGFAAFGQVAAGMDVVLKILNLPANGPARNPVMKGQMLSPPVPIRTMRRA